MPMLPEPKYEPPLCRGDACMNCRKRKIACDGNRSGCNQCLKSQQARKNEDVVAVEPKIAHLEERIDNHFAEGEVVMQDTATFASFENVPADPSFVNLTPNFFPTPSLS
ncbi:hypothetical protein BT69DRAFT_1295116 [Atractiella rhizophila]|nr:hypothetical protein BT69DRAFT_1295116 [Atractiella rhizophila]